MENKYSNWSSFDKKVFEVMKSIVPDQKMKLEDGEGNIYTSECKDTGENMSVVIIKKNDKVIGKSIYDYDSGKEEDFFNSIKGAD